MANCIQCTEFDTCPWRSDPDALCSEYKQKPMTNADRIRSMTDEELAEWLNDVNMCSCSSAMEKSPCDEKDCPCWLDWLRKEVEE